MKRSLSEKAFRLLGTREIPGRPSQKEKFFLRISELADINGEHWVRQNRDALLAQWDKALEIGGIRPSGR